MASNTLSNILSIFLEAIAQAKRIESVSPFLSSLICIYRKITLNEKLSPLVKDFQLDDETTGNIISNLKKTLKEQGAENMNQLNSPLSYLLDELICNIQQHAHTDKGYAYIGYSSDYVELAIADAGITIYGSYASVQKHLDLIGNSDAAALNIAQKGYSTKNLPNAENRGYGISSNIRMIVEGLHGEISILSGNALLGHFAEKEIILALPEEIDFKGTMVIVRFPAKIPNDFNIYNYIN